MKPLSAEAVAAIVAVVIACFLDVDAITRVLLIGSVLLVMIVEILNSAIEAVVDRIGSEFHELSGRAKDMGSAAVLLAIITAAITGSRCFGRISDEPRGIIKSPVFVQFLVPKSPLTVYTHSITVYTPVGGMKALTTVQQEVFDPHSGSYRPDGYATHACRNRAASGLPFS